jgi:uncharacterized membrane protein
VNKVRLNRYWRGLRDRLWVLPLLGLMAGVGLSFALVAIDKAHDYELISHTFTGSATATQQILGVTITALVGLTSIVLTVTLVAVQLAMGQFSPRIVGTLLHDRRSQLSIALFLATLAHAVLTLRHVDARTGQVPGLAVVVAYAMLLGSVAVMVLYTHHASQSLRVGPLIDLVGDGTRDEIERLYPIREGLDPQPAENEVLARKSGNVIRIHIEDLVTVATGADCVIEVVPAMGDYVTEYGVLFRVHGAPARDLEPALRFLVKLGQERTHQDDPGYGIRKLVDIAERSVSSSVWQDPTTSVQAIHRIHEIMRRLAIRELPDGRRHDADGNLRLVLRELNWRGYVRLAFDEIRLAGAGSPQIARRLRAALVDLASVAPPDRKGAIEEQIDLLERAVRRAIEDDEDVDRALTPDTEGIGSGPDVVDVVDAIAR